ncbi:S-layer homology domain-containing protein [Paenisporosarcina cavernae]|uniref:SLH domain-containing protein n=1 Tax=Paenisporosarcina cavernae TaxID=2320858 RepID=A0A385YQW7_9BACL|nr:S-layer homology domain-containing protein [Paenisporosarcina cavernae]AYC28894.1 hypothetical protein D3873_03045 [Paenisporosarcina cavernae]
MIKKLVVLSIFAVSMSIATSAVAESNEFPDVPKSQPFYEHIHYLTGDGIINGYDNGYFKPYTNLTRGEAAMMIARAFDLDLTPRETVFKDVNTRLSGAVQSAYEAHIIFGTSETTFSPSEKITREQMAMLLERAFHLKEQSATEFDDVKMNSVAYTAIRKIQAFGITGGVDENHFNPGGYVSRQHFAAFLARGLNEELRLEASSCGYNVDSRTNPPRQVLNCMITNAARATQGEIPPEIVKGIVNVENGNWKHFQENGEPIISADGGIGLMQITNVQNFDVEKLKYDIEYNIEAGISMLINHFKRTDLPKISEKDPNRLENWYFAIMAYNGTKSVNSPFYKATGEKNLSSYQEKVFQAIRTSSQLEVTSHSILMKPEDFTYGPETNESIVFNRKNMELDFIGTHTRDRFGEGYPAYLTNSRLRTEPSTSAEAVTVPIGTLVEILGAPLYDLSSNAPNNFVWYPVAVNQNGMTRYLYAPSQSVK